MASEYLNILLYNFEFECDVNSFFIIVSRDKILNGESKLAITTECLVMLNAMFRRYSDSDETEPKSTSPRQQQTNNWRKDVEFLQNFITKTPGLKV